MLAAQDVSDRLKEIGVTALHIKIRATGGVGTKTPGALLHAHACSRFSLLTLVLCRHGSQAQVLSLLSALLPALA